VPRSLVQSGYLFFLPAGLTASEYGACEEISRLRGFLDQFSLLSAQIIVGSTREAFDIGQWLEAGAHIVTATLALVEDMIVHPYSKETIQMFLEDAKKLRGMGG